MRRDMGGFTIVELLIVIVVIAILAAITVVAYEGIQQRARTSAIQNDLANAKKKLLLFQVDNGHFPQTGTELGTVGISATKTAYDTSGNNFYYCYNKATDQWAMTGYTPGPNAVAYQITSTNAVKPGSRGADRTCQAAGLTGYSDANATSVAGHTSGAWQSWVR